MRLLRSTFQQRRIPVADHSPFESSYRISWSFSGACSSGKVCQVDRYPYRPSTFDRWKYIDGKKWIEASLYQWNAILANFGPTCRPNSYWKRWGPIARLCLLLKFTCRRFKKKTTTTDTVSQTTKSTDTVSDPHHQEYSRIFLLTCPPVYSKVSCSHTFNHLYEP